jgi:hypothetical protein
VSELNDPSHRDYPAWISPDGCRIYLLSSRLGEVFEVFVATRTPSR